MDVEKTIQFIVEQQARQSKLLLDLASQERPADQFDLRMAELATAQKRTEDNLNALITVVDGIVRGKR